MIKKFLLTTLLILSLTSNCWAATELDYMEYATDGAVREAYPSSDTTTDTTSTQTQTSAAADDSDTWTTGNVGWGQGFKVTTPGDISKFTWKMRKTSGATGTLTGYIYSDDGAGLPNASLATFSAIEMSTLTTTNADYDFTGSFTPPVNTQYHMVVWWTGGTAGDKHYTSYDNNNPYANGTRTYKSSGGSVWEGAGSGIDQYFYLYQNLPHLQDYSEATIKQQGSYSLKGIAYATVSLNDTLTRTVSPTIDLTGQTSWVFYIYAGRTGSNIKVGLHDSGGTTTETTPNVTDAGAWQKVTVNISGVSDENKDAIDQIIITIVNADAGNTFYLDNMYAEPARRRIIMVE